MKDGGLLKIFSLFQIQTIFTNDLQGKMGFIEIKLNKQRLEKNRNAGDQNKRFTPKKDMG